jgi:hypothetical protein
VADEATEPARRSGQGRAIPDHDNDHDNKGSRRRPNALNKGEDVAPQSNQGGRQVKRISYLVAGALLGFAGAPAPASAQDFTAGKTPAQLFSTDCAECHRTPNGLAKGRDVKTLVGYLREHYTTKSDTAGALAAYVSGFAGRGPADVRNSAGGAPPAAAPGDRRNRRDGEGAAAADDARTAAKPPEDQPGRRRRTTNLSGDGEKRRVRNDGDAPRPPANIAAAPAPVRTLPEAEAAPRDATDPMSRLRLYLTSGLGVENTVAEAARSRPPKARKRRDGKDTDQPPPAAPAAAKTGTDAPPAVPGETPGAAATSGAAVAAPPEANAAPAAASGSAPAPPPPPAITAPRLGQ